MEARIVGGHHTPSRALMGRSFEDLIPDMAHEGATPPGGHLSASLSNGLKARGHPVGTTDVSRHVMAARQVTGTSEAIQVPGAGLAAVFDTVGSGVANYCSILEAKT